MEDWENLTEEEKQQFIELIKEKYPEVILELFDAITPVFNAMQPLFEVLAMIMTHIWETFKKAFTETELKALIDKYGPGTSSETTNISQ